MLCLIASDLRKRRVNCEVLLERWKAAWSGPGPNAEGGCPMCAPESLGFLDQRPKEKVNHLIQKERNGSSKHHLFYFDELLNFIVVIFFANHF